MISLVFAVIGYIILLCFAGFDFLKAIKDTFYLYQEMGFHPRNPAWKLCALSFVLTLCLIVLLFKGLVSVAKKRGGKATTSILAYNFISLIMVYLNIFLVQTFGGGTVEITSVFPTNSYTYWFKYFSIIASFVFFFIARKENKTIRFVFLIIALGPIVYLGVESFIKSVGMADISFSGISLLVSFFRGIFTALSFALIITSTFLEKEQIE